MAEENNPIRFEYSDLDLEIDSNPYDKILLSIKDKFDAIIPENYCCHYIEDSFKLKVYIDNIPNDRTGYSPNINYAISKLSPYLDLVADLTINTTYSGWNLAQPEQLHGIMDIEQTSRTTGIVHIDFTQMSNLLHVLCSRQANLNDNETTPVFGTQMLVPLFYTPLYRLYSYITMPKEDWPKLVDFCNTAYEEQQKYNQHMSLLTRYAHEPIEFVISKAVLHYWIPGLFPAYSYMAQYISIKEVADMLQSYIEGKIKEPNVIEL